MDDFCNDMFPDFGLEKTFSSDNEKVIKLSDAEKLINQKRLEDFIQPFIDESEKLETNEKNQSNFLTNQCLLSSFSTDKDIGKAARIKIHKVSGDESFSHEVAVPPTIEFEPLKEIVNPLKTYPFELDNFQKAAIKCIDNRQSVLVSAHTSAGKTVIAEYAIAKALSDKQRVIYTTPIKALSNQKYREFSEEFSEVGLLTGDVTLSPNASVLIMTTEILQSMLYRGSSIMREVGWVIFDEIHYMRDRERGVVWEESIVLLPDEIRCAFLSATIPNARQFAEWISFLHNQLCHVVFTEYRPVPLQHYVFPCNGDGLLLVVDDKGRFLEDNFKSAMNKLGPNSDSTSERAGSIMVARSQKNESNVFKIVRLIMEHKLEPLIVFSFSKKECEIYATQLAKLNFNSDEETAYVDEVFKNAMECLSDADKELPQVLTSLPLLRRGIGVHHGGLLPILKETVEILFSEGLLKCLFATETFAMGLNMPARTVLFTSARKYDGSEYRWISANEYIQMSGRAGRRGKDERGTVILMVDETMSDTDARNIIQGTPDPLNSAFHITYNMLLNLMRVEGINPEYMIERSFFQFQNQAFVPEAEENLKLLTAAYEKMKVEQEELVSSYFKLDEALQNAYFKEMDYIHKSSKLINFMQPGRLIKIKRDNEDFGWGAVVNIKRQQPQLLKYSSTATDEALYLVECLLTVAARPNDNKKTPTRAPRPGEAKVAEVTLLKLKTISAISAVRLVMPQDLRPAGNREKVIQNIEKIKEKFFEMKSEMMSSNKSPSVRSEDLPILDAVKDVKIDDESFLKIKRKIESYEKKLNNHEFLNVSNYDGILKEYREKEKKRLEIENLEKEIIKKRSIVQMNELKSRKRVLRRLNYCNDKDVIELKGRVACEITGADELLVTELLLKGVFNNLTPSQTAAFVSCLVFEEKSSEMPTLNPSLSTAFRTLQNEAKILADISVECRLDVNSESYVDSFKPHMMDVVLRWADGQTFLQLVNKTTIFEGSIIRCIRLLEEVLRQLANAAKTIGNTNLEEKFLEAIRLIKRDIVFAASLYL